MPQAVNGPWRPWPSAKTEACCVIAVLSLSLAVFYAIYMPFIPNESGGVGSDYAIFLPGLLAGYYWILHNGFLSIPWFSPSQCGGLPFFADPQIGYFSLPQLLTIWVSPLQALQGTFLSFATIGFLGTYALARRSFQTSLSGALLGGAFFMFNGFYASRMLVGHMTYHAFMVLPLMTAAVLPAPEQRSIGSTRSILLRAGAAGLCQAYMVQSGMVHIYAPAVLSCIIVIFIYVQRFGWRSSPFVILAASLVVGVLLSAGKLTASLAFLANFPRNDYPLPGFASLLSDVRIALTTLFFAPPADPVHSINNTLWVIGREEWEYSISPVPLALMTAAAAVFLVRFRFPKLSRYGWISLVGIGSLLIVPIGLNWYVPAWNSFLKSVPLLGSSSNLLRWFSAYILPAIVVSLLAFDYLCLGARLKIMRQKQAGTALAIGCVAALFAFVFLKDLSPYGVKGRGDYAVHELEEAYARASLTRIVPPITAVVVVMDREGHALMTPQRDDAMIRGHSELFCYQSIFGYHLEQFPIKALHPGLALSSSGGLLNVKNLACYIFPQENSCKPGDHFAVADADQAQAFLNYRPFPFEMPGYATAANWASFLTLILTLSGMLVLPLLRGAKSPFEDAPV